MKRNHLPVRFFEKGHEIVQVFFLKGEKSDTFIRGKLNIVRKGIFLYEKVPGF